MRQLDPSHEELREKGFLSRWSYRKLRSGGFMVMWHAGEQYYDDRAQLERLKRSEFKQLEMEFGEASERRSSFSALSEELVQVFHRRLGRGSQQPSTAELAKCEGLIEQHGAEAARFLVEFALVEAKKSRFAMRDFGAVKTYVDEGLVLYRKRCLGREEQEESVEAHEVDELIAYFEGLVKVRGKCGAPDVAVAEDMLVRLGMQGAKKVVRFSIGEAQRLGKPMERFGHIDELMSV